MMRREALPRVFLLLLLIALLGYGLFQSRNLIRGPVISIEEPDTAFLSLAEPLFKISGTTQNVSDIRLNGASIFVDESGSFREALVAPQGYTIMTVTVTDRFGRERSQQLEIYRPYGTQKENRHESSTSDES